MMRAGEAGRVISSRPPLQDFTFWNCLQVPRVFCSDVEEITVFLETYKGGQKGRVREGLQGPENTGQ